MKNIYKLHLNINKIAYKTEAQKNAQNDWSACLWKFTVLDEVCIQQATKS
jgi:hypothetical protein